MSCQIEILEDVGDIPFITEIDEENVSRKPPPSPRNTRGSFRSNRTISPSSSTSSSFKCSTPVGTPNPFCQNAFLLNEVYGRRSSTASNPSFHQHHHHHRRRSSRRSCQFQNPSSNKSRRSSAFSIGAKGSSARSSRRESKLSYVSVGEWGERRRSVHIPPNRRNSSTKRRAVSKQVSLEQQAKSRKRRTIGCVLFGTFLFILICSVTAVVVTLTHQSKFVSENKTLMYYTFSPDAKIVVLENNDFLDVNKRGISRTATKKSQKGQIRKENEELMNSLHREPSGHHHSSHNFTPAQAQD